jgi:hypothetical protein
MIWTRRECSSMQRFRRPLYGDGTTTKRGFKSCPHDRSAATVVAIELELKGFAGARNHLNLEFWWSAA